MIFHNRSEAGKYLANKLAQYTDREDLLVLALPRGGVPVGFEVARKLNAPLDIFLVRKLGVPGQEELAMGAIASGGVRVLNREVVDYLGIPGEVIDAVGLVVPTTLKRTVALAAAPTPTLGTSCTFPEVSTLKTFAEWALS